MVKAAQHGESDDLSAWGSVFARGAICWMEDAISLQFSVGLVA
jgi:hypothetical protein